MQDLEVVHVLHARARAAVRAAVAARGRGARERAPRRLALRRAAARELGARGGALQVDREPPRARAVVGVLDRLEHARVERGDGRPHVRLAREAHAAANRRSGDDDFSAMAESLSSAKETTLGNGLQKTVPPHPRPKKTKKKAVGGTGLAASVGGVSPYEMSTADIIVKKRPGQKAKEKKERALAKKREAEEKERLRQNQSEVARIAFFEILDTVADLYGVPAPSQRRISSLPTMWSAKNRVPRACLVHHFPHSSLLTVYDKGGCHERRGVWVITI